METVHFRSPLGIIELSVSGGRLRSVRLLPSGTRRKGRSKSPHSPAMTRYLKALERYFAGRAPRLSPEDLNFGDCTAFALKVYRALMKVGFGEIVTYGDLARRAGDPRAARAVGQALGRNPLPVFVPCHRVVASDSRLGGFGAGPAWKAGLLRHEGWAVVEGRVS